jgi:phage-related minor tail protein
MSQNMQSSAIPCKSLNNIGKGDLGSGGSSIRRAVRSVRVAQILRANHPIIGNLRSGDIGTTNNSCLVGRGTVVRNTDGRVLQETNGGRSAGGRHTLACVNGLSPDGLACRAP